MDKEYTLPDIPKVKEIFSRKVIAFSKEFKIFDAIKNFNKFRISSAPVTNTDNKVVGYLSESDCIKYLSNCLYYDEARNRSIETFMSKKLAKVDLEWDVFELENFFIKNNLKSASIIDDENHLLGIVSRRDILLAFEKYLNAREKYKVFIQIPIELDLKQRTKVIVDNYRSHF